METSYITSPGDIYQFGRLDKDAQAQVISALERTRAMIHDYCNGSEPNYGKVLRQLLTPLYENTRRKRS